MAQRIEVTKAFFGNGSEVGVDDGSPLLRAARESTRGSLRTTSYEFQEKVFLKSGAGPFGKPDLVQEITSRGGKILYGSLELQGSRDEVRSAMGSLWGNPNVLNYGGRNNKVVYQGTGAGRAPAYNRDFGGLHHIKLTTAKDKRGEFFMLSMANLTDYSYQSGKNSYTGRDQSGHLNYYVKSYDKGMVREAQAVQNYLYGKGDMPRGLKHFILAGPEGDKDVRGRIGKEILSGKGDLFIQVAELERGTIEGYIKQYAAANPEAKIHLMLKFGGRSRSFGDEVAFGLKGELGSQLQLYFPDIKDNGTQHANLIFHARSQIQGSMRMTEEATNPGGKHYNDHSGGQITDMSVITHDPGVFDYYKSEFFKYARKYSVELKSGIYTTQIQKFMPALTTAKLRYALDPTMLRGAREHALLNLRYKVGGRLDRRWNNPMGEDRSKDVLLPFEYTEGIGSSLYRQLGALHGEGFGGELPDEVQAFDLGMQARTVGQSDVWSPAGYAGLAAVSMFGLSSAFGNTQIFTGLPSMPGPRAPREKLVYQMPGGGPGVMSSGATLAKRLGHAAFQQRDASAIGQGLKTRLSGPAGRVDRAFHHVMGLNVTHAAVAGILTYGVSSAMQILFTDNAFVQVGNRGPLSSMLIRASRDLDGYVDASMSQGAVDQAQGKILEGAVTGGIDFFQSIALNLAGYHWFSLTFMRLTSGAWDNTDRILKHYSTRSNIGAGNKLAQGALSLSERYDKALSRFYGHYVDQLWRPILGMLGKDFADFAENSADELLKGDKKFRAVRLGMIEGRDALFARSPLSFISEVGMGGLFKNISPRLFFDTGVRMSMAGAGLAKDVRNLLSSRYRNTLDDLLDALEDADDVTVDPKQNHRNLNAFANTIRGNAVQSIMTRQERDLHNKYRREAARATSLERRAYAESKWQKMGVWTQNFDDDIYWSMKRAGHLDDFVASNDAFRKLTTFERQLGGRLTQGGGFGYNFNYHLTQAIDGVQTAFAQSLGFKPGTNIGVRQFSGMGERAFWFTAAGVLFGDAILGEIGAAPRVTMSEQFAFANAMNARSEELGGMHHSMMVWYTPGMARYDSVWAKQFEENRLQTTLWTGLAAQTFGFVQGTRRFGAGGGLAGSLVGLAAGLTAGHLFARQIGQGLGLAAGAAQLMTTEKVQAWWGNLRNLGLERGLRTEVAGPGAFAEAQYASMGGMLDEQERKRLAVVGELLERSDDGLHADILGLAALMTPSANQRLQSAKYGDSYALQITPDPMMMTFTFAANKMQDKTRLSFTIQAPAIFQVGYSLVSPIGIQHSYDADGNETWSPTYIGGGSLEKWAHAAVTAKAVETLWSLGGRAAGLHTATGRAGSAYRGLSVVGGFYKGMLNLGWTAAKMGAGFIRQGMIDRRATKALRSLGMEDDLIRDILHGDKSTRYSGYLRLQRVREWARDPAQQARNVVLEKEHIKAIRREGFTSAQANRFGDDNWIAQDTSGSRGRAARIWRNRKGMQIAKGINRGMGGAAVVMLAGAVLQGLLGSAGHEQGVTQSWGGMMKMGHDMASSGNPFLAAASIPLLFGLNYMGVGHATHPDVRPTPGRAPAVFGDGKSMRGYDHSATFWNSLFRPFQQQADAFSNTYYAGPGSAFLGTGTFGAVMDDAGEMMIWSKSYLQLSPIPGVQWAYARGAIGINQNVDLENFTSAVNFDTGRAMGNVYALVSNRVRRKKQGRVASVGKLFHDQSALGTLGRSGQAEMYRRSELTRWMTTNGSGLDAAVYFFVDRRKRYYDAYGRAVPANMSLLPPMMSEGFSGRFDKRSGLISTWKSTYDLFRGASARGYATGELAELDLDNNTQILSAHSGWDAPRGTNAQFEYMKDKYGEAMLWGGMVGIGASLGLFYGLAMWATTVENIGNKALGAELRRTSSGFIRGTEEAKYMTLYGVDPTKDGRLIFKDSQRGAWKGASYQHPSHKYWLAGIGEKFYTYGPQGLMTSDLSGGNHGLGWNASMGVGNKVQVNVVSMRTIFREATELSFDGRLIDQLAGKREGATGMFAALERLVEGKRNLVEASDSLVTEMNRAYNATYDEWQQALRDGDTVKANAMKELYDHHGRVSYTALVLQDQLHKGGVMGVDARMEKAHNLLATERERLKGIDGWGFEDRKRALDTFAQEVDIDGNKVIDAHGNRITDASGNKVKSLFEVIQHDLVPAQEGPLMRNILDGTLLRENGVAVKSLEEGLGWREAKFSHAVRTTGGMSAVFDQSMRAAALRLGGYFFGETKAHMSFKDWAKAEAYRRQVQAFTGALNAHVVSTQTYSGFDDMLKGFFDRAAAGDVVDLDNEAEFRKVMQDLPDDMREKLQRDLGRAVGKGSMGALPGTAWNYANWVWSGVAMPRVWKYGGAALKGGMVGMTGFAIVKGYQGTLFGLGEAGDIERAYSDRLYAARAAIADTPLLAEGIAMSGSSAVGYVAQGAWTGFREGSKFATSQGRVGASAFAAGMRGMAAAALGNEAAWGATTHSALKAAQAAGATAGTLIETTAVAGTAAADITRTTALGRAVAMRAAFGGGVVAGAKAVAKTGLGRMGLVVGLGAVGFGAAKLLGASNEASLLAGGAVAGLGALALMTVGGPLGIALSLGVSIIGYKLVEGHVNKWLDGAFKGHERDITKWMDEHRWAAGALAHVGRAGAQWQNLMDGTFGEWGKMMDDPRTNIFQKAWGGFSKTMHWAFSSFDTGRSQSYTFFDPERAPATSLSSQGQYWRMAGNMGSAAFAATMTPLWHGEMRDAVNAKLSEQERIRVGNPEGLAREWFHESHYGGHEPVGRTIMTSAVDPHKGTSIWKNFGNLSQMGEGTKGAVNRRAMASQFVMTRLLERWDVWNDWSRTSQSKWDTYAKKANLADKPKGPGGANVMRVRSQYHTVMLGVHDKHWGTIDPDLPVELRSKVRGYVKPGEFNKPGPGTAEASQTPAVLPKTPAVAKPVTPTKSDSHAKPEVPVTAPGMGHQVTGALFVGKFALSAFERTMDFVLGVEPAAAATIPQTETAKQMGVLTGEEGLSIGRPGAPKMQGGGARAKNEKVQSVGVLGAIGKFMGWFGSLVGGAVRSAWSAMTGQGSGRGITGDGTFLGGSSQAQRFVDRALEFKGQRYVTGGGHRGRMTSVGGVDCSGLVGQAALEVGVGQLATTADLQSQMGKAVDMKTLKPGDLVFRNIQIGVSGHVGIYVGNGQVLQAGSGTGRVYLSALSSQKWDFARRVFKDEGGAPGAVRKNLPGETQKPENGVGWGASRLAGKTAVNSTASLTGVEAPLPERMGSSKLGLSERMLDNLQKYDPIVQKAAKKFGVPVNLVRAVILQESGGESNTRSWVGAQGLMQVMPEYHRERAKRLTGSTNLYDPVVNIMTGTAILADNLRNKSWGGDVALALAAYNGGAGANKMSRDKGHEHQRVWQNPNNWTGRDSYGQTARYIEAVGAYYMALNKATGYSAPLNTELLEKAVEAADINRQNRARGITTRGTYEVSATEEGAAVDNHGENGEGRTGVSVYKDPHTERLVARATYPDGSKWMSAWDQHFTPVENSGLDNHAVNSSGYGGM